MQDLMKTNCYDVNDTMIIVEHESKKEPVVNEKCHVVKNRSWGFCAVTIYQLNKEGE